MGLRAKLALAVRLAIRELRGGLKGFYVFLACLTLGVAAISGVGSLSRGLSEGLLAQGQEILGGDISLRLTHRQADTGEREFLARAGRVSEIATMNAMARVEEPGAGPLSQALVELKAIDDAYPLYGSIDLAPNLDVTASLSRAGPVWGAAAEPALLDRLSLAIGDKVKIGEALFEIRARLTAEPDRLASGLSFGPRLLISGTALTETGLLRPGSLVRWHYRIRLPDNARTDQDLKRFAALARAEQPQSGWRIRDRTNASPGVRRAIDRLTQILELVGLTILAVGGIGIANAVRGHLDAKRRTIATFKCLGAPGDLVTLVYLFEIAIIAGVGIGAGLIVGALLPTIVAPLAADLWEIPINAALYGAPLVLAAAYGVLIALAFSLWPLGACRRISAAALFRDLGQAARPLPGWRYMLGAVLAGAALVVLALVTAVELRIAMIYLAGIVGAFAALVAFAWAIVRVARGLPRSTRPELRLAIGNIHRPGALTRSVVLSLGLGLTLLVALAQIDRNLTRELTGAIPENAPSFFFVDVQRRQADAFADLLRRTAPDGQIGSVPMMRGRITRLNDIPAERIEPPPGGRWVLRGDRGITYSDHLPEGSRLVQGTWWPADYGGPPLVSFEATAAGALGLEVGSLVEVNVLGRTIRAQIANLRELDWASMGINFVMVFSPNAFAGAPHMMLSTLTLPEAAGSERETQVQRAVTASFPNVTAVRVKDVLDRASAIMRDVLWAIRSASSITIVASVLVLAGALAAGHRTRLFDAAILKTLGATRRRLMVAYMLEYLMLGLATAAFAGLAGSLAAYAVLKFVMNVGFVFVPTVAFGTALAAALLMVLLGLAANWRLFGSKPAPILRSH